MTLCDLPDARHSCTPQGLGSILTTGDYGDFVLFLRVPRLVGLLIWQWLTYRHFTGLPELGFQVLASSTGDVLPQLYNWDQAMALDLPVVLQRLADLPQNLKDAESWSLMDLEAEDSSTWPWESAHAGVRCVRCVGRSSSATKVSIVGKSEITSKRGC